MEIIKLKFVGYRKKMKLIENRKCVYFNIFDVLCNGVPNIKRKKHP